MILISAQSLQAEATSALTAFMHVQLVGALSNKCLAGLIWLAPRIKTLACATDLTGPQAPWGGACTLPARRAPGR